MTGVPFDGSALLVDATRVALEESCFLRESSRPTKPRRLESVRAALRVRHYSRRTEETYADCLDREGLGRELSWLDGVVRARKPRRLPVVLARGRLGPDHNTEPFMRKWDARPDDPTSRPR